MKRSLPEYFVILVLVAACVFVVGNLRTEAAGEQTKVYVGIADAGQVVTPYYALLAFRPVKTSLEGTNGLACSPDEGKLYVVETWKDRIIRFDQSGSGEEEVVTDLRNYTRHLAFSPDGDLYYTTSEALWRLEGGRPSNTPERLISEELFNEDEEPYDLAFLTGGEYSGDLIMTMTSENSGRVVRVPGPEYDEIRPFISTFVTEGPKEETKHLKNPTGLAVSSTGAVYVADFAREYSHVLQYTPHGNFERIFTTKISHPNDLEIAGDTLYATTSSFGWEGAETGSLRRYDIPTAVVKPTLSRLGAWAIAVCGSREEGE